MYLFQLVETLMVKNLSKLHHISYDMLYPHCLSESMTHLASGSFLCINPSLHFIQALAPPGNVRVWPQHFLNAGVGPGMVYFTTQLQTAYTDLLLKLQTTCTCKYMYIHVHTKCTCIMPIMKILSNNHYDLW